MISLSTITNSLYDQYFMLIYSRSTMTSLSTITSSSYDQYFMLIYSRSTMTSLSTITSSSYYQYFMLIYSRSTMTSLSTITSQSSMFSMEISNQNIDALLSFDISANCLDVCFHAFKKGSRNNVVHSSIQME